MVDHSGPFQGRYPVISALLIFLPLAHNFPGLRPAWQGPGFGPPGCLKLHSLKPTSLLSSHVPNHSFFPVMTSINICQVLFILHLVKPAGPNNVCYRVGPVLRRLSPPCSTTVLSSFHGRTQMSSLSQHKHLSDPINYRSITITPVFQIVIFDPSRCPWTRRFTE